MDLLLETNVLVEIIVPYAIRCVVRPIIVTSYLHVFAQRRRMRVGFVAAVDAAIVRLVGGVHV